MNVDRVLCRVTFHLVDAEKAALLKFQETRHVLKISAASLKMISQNSLRLSMCTGAAPDAQELQTHRVDCICTWRFFLELALSLMSTGNFYRDDRRHVLDYIGRLASRWR